MLSIYLRRFLPIGSANTLRKTGEFAVVEESAVTGVFLISVEGGIDLHDEGHDFIEAGRGFFGEITRPSMQHKLGVAHDDSDSIAKFVTHIERQWGVILKAVDCSTKTVKINRQNINTARLEIIPGAAAAQETLKLTFQRLNLLA